MFISLSSPCSSVTEEGGGMEPNLTMTIRAFFLQSSFSGSMSIIPSSYMDLDKKFPRYVFSAVSAILPYPIKK
jgi:hypothetical protein